MNTFTLACLLGTASSMKMMVDLSDDNTTGEALTDASCHWSIKHCGSDPCMDANDLEACAAANPEW